jgi:hypothetical protein
MSDFASVTQAIVDSTSTAMRSIAGNAEKLAPHAANALAARAIAWFVAPATVALVAAVLVGLAWQKAVKNDWQESNVVLVVALSIALLGCVIASLATVGDAIAAWCDPVGYMILTLMGK